MAEVFHIIGQVINKQGFALQNLKLAVVDSDRLFDDLLGVGFTDGNGEFQLSFTREEFNQDLFENDSVPSLRLIFSIVHEGEFKVVHQATFPGLGFETLSEDLGAICIETWDKVPTFFEGVDPTPGLDKRVERLNITDELIEHCLDEVAPMVESLTGWESLLDDVTVVITDDLSPYLQSFSGLFEGKPSWLFRKLSRMLERLSTWSSQIVAFYEPNVKSIVIHRSRASNCVNLDGLKVILGHELVHVGQFKHCPEMIAQYNSQLNWLTHFLDELGAQGEINFEEIRAAIEKSALQEYMSELEGYAAYIQHEFLEKHYNMATFFTHASMFDGILRGIMSNALPELTESQNLKHRQYLEGHNAYKALEVGNRPVKFKRGVLTK